MQVCERLHQHHGGHLAEPGPLLGALGGGDDLLLKIGVLDVRQPRRVRFPTCAKRIVEDDPRAAERFRKFLPLARCGVQPEVVPELHPHILLVE
ncbi:hypothetical protein GCM10022285_18720 [Streptomyces tunisiensis]|uniref:Aminoglycoside phosphotransferase domain-containing protein n=1 Tax=Streptomyces tunisiensis TaxID=948699 RepID=A0ABP7Y3N5_9ACTN